MRNKSQLKFEYGLEIKIGADEPVRKMVEICEDLDYGNLLTEYVRAWRKVNPITLFQIVLLDYMTGNYSARKIEEACKN